jgi:hypothetical protein
MRQFTAWPAIAALASLAACDRTDNGAAAAAGDAAAAPGLAAEAAQSCPEFPKNSDAGEGNRPVVVPARFASYVRASDTTLSVQRSSGRPACIDIGGVGVESLDSFLDGRLIGATIYGNEYNSYMLVDRHTGAEPLETGVKPVFSPSGRRFASVDISEAGFGAFEALGVWEISDSAIRNLVTLEDILDRGYDWRVVRWSGDDCIVFSTAADPTGVDLETRKFHELRLTAHPALKDVAEEAACNG